MCRGSRSVVVVWLVVIVSVVRAGLLVVVLVLLGSSVGSVLGPLYVQRMWFGTFVGVSGVLGL